MSSFFYLTLKYYYPVVVVCYLYLQLLVSWHDCVIYDGRTHNNVSAWKKELLEFFYQVPEGSLNEVKETHMNHDMEWDAK